MSEQQGALVGLGRAAAGIQRRPAGMASTNEEMLVFNICMDTAIGLWGKEQRDRDSLSMGIARELKIDLVRKDKMAARKHRNDRPLLDGCLDVAQQFVDHIWLKSLNGHPPSQTTRRLFGSVYCMAFLTAALPGDDTHSNNNHS